MTATQSIQRDGATLRRAACRGAAALPTIDHEQVRATALPWPPSPAPADPPGPPARTPNPDRPGPLARTPNLDRPRLTGRHLPSPGESRAAHRP